MWNLALQQQSSCFLSSTAEICRLTSELGVFSFVFFFFLTLQWDLTVFRGSVCIQQMSWFCFHLSEVLGTLEPLKWNDPGGLAGIKDLSFTCWSVMLLTVFHKQILTGLWQQKRKNFALDISLNTLQQCYNQPVSISRAFFFNEDHFQLFSSQCCTLTFSQRQILFDFLHRHVCQEYWDVLSHSPYTDCFSLLPVPEVLCQGCSGFLLCVSLSLFV